jgi:hypothetical protein
MFLTTLQSAWWAMREPRIFLFSAATTIGCGFALGALGAGGEAASGLSSTAISAIVILLIARAWSGLAIAATTLAVLRDRRHAPWIAGVGLVPAMRALIVAVPPLAPLLVGAFLTLVSRALITLLGAVLIVAGAFWAAAWSQAGMLIVDGRADLMGSGESSVDMTRGYRGEILGIWLLIGTGVAGATWLDLRLGTFMAGFSLGPPIAAIAHLALRVVSDAFCTCAVAAMYYELDKTETET